MIYILKDSLEIEPYIYRNSTYEEDSRLDQWEKMGYSIYSIGIIV